MKKFLKSIVFGVVSTAVISTTAYLIAQLIISLSKLGDIYPFIPVAILVCIAISATCYYTNK